MARGVQRPRRPLPYRPRNRGPLARQERREGSKDQGCRGPAVPDYGQGRQEMERGRPEPSEKPKRRTRFLHQGRKKERGKQGGYRSEEERRSHQPGNRYRRRERIAEAARRSPETCSPW